MRTLLTADRIWNGSDLIDDPIVVIDDNLISSLGTRVSQSVPTTERTIDLPGCTLSPAFFDVHIHGAAGHDVMEATPEALAAIGRFLASHGTGSYLATTVTAPLDETLRSFAGLAKLFSRTDRQQAIAQPVGIHLEGPFLSHTKRGVHPPEHLLDPDIEIFDKMYEAAEGQIRLVTLAPELPGAAAFAAHLITRGVRVSMGHSNATAAQTQPIVDAGALSITHTFNAMRALDHREPGILGVALTNDSLFAELICDGVHVAPEIVKLWWRAKGAARGILVTDAMSATGMPEGTYRLGGFNVEVANGKATADGVLAGSVLTLDRALENFIRYTDAPIDQALRLLTTNPATMIAATHSTGRLVPGVAANLVAIDATGKRVSSFQNGIRCN